jgi:hypothetical protein
MHGEGTGRKEVNGAVNDENNGTSNKGLNKYGGYRTLFPVPATTETIILY